MEEQRIVFHKYFWTGNRNGFQPVDLLFVADDLSYDRFNTDADRIYRVAKDFVNADGSRLADATTSPAAAPAIQKKYQVLNT